MNDLQLFKNNDFGSVRTITDGGKVLFCGKDVTTALGYADTINAIKQHCRGVVKRHPIQDSLGRTQEARFISEGDVYRLITHSKLPSAERFERWVFDEVLPSIRCSGAYAMSETTARQIAYIKELQRRLAEWKALDEQFTEITADARKRYIDNRATRDKCRVSVTAIARQLEGAINELSVDANLTAISGN